MDFSKLLPQEPNCTGSFECQHEECTQLASEGHLGADGVLKYVCDDGHSNEAKLHE